MRKSYTIRAFEMEIERLEREDSGLEIDYNAAFDHMIYLRNERVDIRTKITKVKSELKAAK